MPGIGEAKPSPALALHRPLCPEGRAAHHSVCDTPCAERARPLVLAATIIASAMAFIDGTVITIALPALQSDLGASFWALQWIANAYALLLGGLILIGGAAGDRFGRRRVFVSGIGIFAVASLACAIAPNVQSLILARGVQGVGAALLVPQSLAIIASSFPKDVRGRAIGIWAGASAITTAMGPPVGGVLIDALDWRAVFWINLPLSVAAIWLALRYIPESRNEAASGQLDLFGGVVVVLALGAMTIGLTELSEPGDTKLFGAAALSLGAGGLVAFARIEGHATNPLMPLSLFRSRVFSAANVMTLFLYGALAGILFLLPFDLIARRGLSATEAGLTLLPVGIIIGLLSRPAGGLADRHGPRLFLVCGSLLVAAAAVGLSVTPQNFSFAVVLPVVLLSAGMAVVVAPLTTAVMNATSDAHAGTASGVNNAASRLAGLFAVAIVGTVASFVFLAEAEAEGVGSPGLRFGILPDAAHPDRAPLEAAFLSGYSVALWVAAGWSVLAAAIAFWFMGPRSDRPVVDSSGIAAP